MSEQCPRDWTEDFAHENGQYQSICCKCGWRFTGHKRRVICKTCGDSPDPTPAPDAAASKDHDWARSESPDPTPAPEPQRDDLDTWANTEQLANQLRRLAEVRCRSDGENDPKEYSEWIAAAAIVALTERIRELEDSAGGFDNDRRLAEYRVKELEEWIEEIVEVLDQLKGK